MEIRFYLFISILLLFLFLEHFFSYRKVNFNLKRQASNLSLIILSSLTVKVLGVASATSFAAQVSKSGGLIFSFNESCLHTLYTVLFLDFMIYLQHVGSHRFPLLWRLHKVHHCDNHLDVSSALRFHPIEIILSLIYKLLLIKLFGLNMMGVLIFEILLNALAMFNHANIKLPMKLERKLSKLIATPMFHRIHHSVNKEETNSNYGFNLTLWDFLFRTVRPLREGVEYGTIMNEKNRNLKELLIMPFKF